MLGAGWGLAVVLEVTGVALAAPSPAGGGQLRIAKPETVGISSERLRRITEMVERQIAAQEYAGVVTLVARNGRIVHFEARGSADGESARPLTRDAVFRLASMTKVVTAVAVLVLVEEGTVRLTDPVGRFLPEFRGLQVAVPDPGASPDAATARYRLEPAARPITVRDLLTHSSGLGSGPISQAALAKDPLRPGEDLATAARRYARCPLDFQPGSRFAYSGLAGFDVLGRIVEVASGSGLEAFVQERICRPLGMKDTTFAPTPEQRKRLVTLTARVNGRLTRAPEQNLLIDPACPHGAGGMVGTVEDYWRLAQMLANGGELNGRRVLSPQTVALLSGTHLPDTFPGLGGGQGWGLGVRVITDGAATGTLLSTGTYGWSGAWGTHFWIDPAQKLVAVYMANETTAGGAGAVSARDFETAVMQSLTTLYRPLP